MSDDAATYIRQALQQGKSREEIYKELLGRGSTIEAIQAGFGSISFEQSKEGTQRKTVSMIVTIAAILVGAGIFSFIASNWQGMDKPMKITVITSLMVLSYALGWYLKEKLNFVKSGGSLIFLGLIIYGAGIFLVAQMFNIRASWPDGFILWMMGAVAMAYAAGLPFLYYSAIVFGVIAVLGYPVGLVMGFTYGLFLLTSSGLLVAATVVTFLAGWVVRKAVPEDLRRNC